MIEAEPNLTVLEARQLLLGNPRQPYQLRAAHAARGPARREARSLPRLFCPPCHREIVSQISACELGSKSAT